MLSRGFSTVGLLVISNCFMTLAWYLHLKLQTTKFMASWPIFYVIVFSWAIAFFEYSCMIPANRIGFVDNGGPFTLVQLKIIQEVITLLIFTVFSLIFFHNQSLGWNHLAAFVCLVMAVFFVFLK